MTGQNNNHVNDLHSQLNATRVEHIERIRSEDDIRRIVAQSKTDKRTLAICGGRGAMGGQQFLSDQLLLDMSDYNQLIAFNTQSGQITAQAGISWTQLFEYLAGQNKSAGNGWGVKQKQTGADFMSLGGSIAANAHGRGLTFAPLVADVISMRIVTADAECVFCSREHNSELFSLVAGGYGLFGVVSEITLQLVPRYPIQRIVELTSSEALADKFSSRIKEGFAYGDFQFSCDDASDDFLKNGVFSCYRRVNETELEVPLHDIESGNSHLSEQDWRQLILLAHVQKTQAFKAYANFYLNSSGQYYWSDTHQLSLYIDNYHQEIDQVLASPHKGSEMITELFVPRASLDTFLSASRTVLREKGANVIYGTIRLIERDSDSFLAWAKQDYACIIFNLHIDHHQEGIQAAKGAFQSLIDLALELNGSFFLTYHRWASKAQLLKAYPQIVEFLKLKRRYDPEELFSSDWYQHLKHTFAAELEPKLEALDEAR